MQQTGLCLNLDARVGELAVGDRQRLEILKTLFRGARILLLDEPTAVLTPQEAEQLFAVLRTLRDQGTTVVLITHKLKEVLQLCDTVTVMRAGRVVQEMPTAQADVDVLAHAMVGRKVQTGRSQALRELPGEVLLRAEGLVWVDASKVRQVDAVDVHLRAGQITGLAGVSGNGQTPLLEILSGLRAPQAGRLALAGQQFEAPQWLGPQTARHLGLAHVPEDRQARALVMEFAAWESAVLGYEATPAHSRHGWMRHGAMQSEAQQLMAQFGVQPRNARLRSSRFSGGNQQKLVLAREFQQAPRVLLVGQPTRGVDIGAIEFIYARLRALRDAGCAIFLVSSELDEILALSDRVLVMHQGRVVGDLDVADCSELVLGRLLSGGVL
jgi:simple sugar transport system ATP-binding protein